MLNEEVIEIEEENKIKTKEELLAEKLEARKNFSKGVKNLLKYMGKFWPMLVVAIFFTLAAAAAMVFSPMWIQKLTDEIAIPYAMHRYMLETYDISVLFIIDLEQIFRYGIIYLTFIVISAVLDYIQSLIMVRVNNKVAMDLRAKISKKINTVPLSYYDKNTVGDVLSRATNDVDRIGETLTWSFTPLISNLTVGLGTLGVMFYHSWALALTAFATLPVAFIFIVVGVALGQKYFKRQADYLGEMNGLIEENFSGQVVVKAFNGQNKSKAEFRKINKKHYQASFGSQGFQSVIQPIVMFVMALGLIGVSVVGGVLHLRPSTSFLHVSIGMITSFTIYVMMFQQGIGSIGEHIGGVQAAAAASCRVFDFLEEKSQEDESYKGQPLTEDIFRGKIEFKNVKFGYDKDKTIIHNFSAVVEPGQKVAIVGPTGAGKTTMVNLLMRFYEIDGGQILIDGVDIKDMKRENVRELFGMVLQDTWLFNGTIKENIKYSLEGVTDEQIKEVCRIVGIDHFIRGLPGGYDLVLDDEVSIASGQKQLLTIARAMLQDSPCLILDEATSNIDTRTEKQIQDAMDKLTKGRTSFVIAHRLSTIKNADLIITMKDGDVVETGSHNELMAKGGFYSELYNAQFTA